MSDLAAAYQAWSQTLRTALQAIATASQHHQPIAATRQACKVHEAQVSAAHRALLALEANPDRQRRVISLSALPHSWMTATVLRHKQPLHAAYRDRATRQQGELEAFLAEVRG